MSSTALTKEDFAKTIEDNDVVLIDFWADWCAPCKRFEPIYEEAAERHTDVVFGKVDTEDQQALAAGAGITSIPTIMAFKEGMLVFRQSGALPARDLESVLTQVKELDMDDVRAKLAAQQGQQA